MHTRVLIGLLFTFALCFISVEAAAVQLQETTKKSARGRSYIDVSTDKGKYIGTYEAGRTSDQKKLVDKAKKAEAKGE